MRPVVVGEPVRARRLGSPAVPSSAVKVRRHPVHAGLGPRVRVRPWAFDSGVVQLALADQGIVPDASRRSAAGSTRSAPTDPTLRHVRTGALFADAAERFATAGFEVIDTLALLRIDLSQTAPRGARRDPHVAAARPPPRARRRGSTARRSVTRGATTPATSPRSAGRRRCTGPAPASSPAPDHGRQPSAAFAITGAAAGHGYLQRLAVAPDHQGQGHGRALVLDSLRWMRPAGSATAS